MIKLIATDMDGTLVNNKGNINENIFELIHDFHDKNVKFVAASGRFYSQLNNNFKKVKGDMILIAHNGAVIKYNNNGKTLYTNAMKKEDMKTVINYKFDLSGFVFLGGESTAYVIDPSKELLDKFDKSEVPVGLVNSLDDISVPIYKITYYIAEGASSEFVNNLRKSISDNLEVVVSGYNWVDVMNKGVAKGSAVKILQEKFEISSKNTMVFGDYYNDLSMFKVAHHSYAMKNAPEDVKQNANFIADSNDNDGVYKVLSEYIQKL
ncbi:Cof-type HAD-IIB family hydrolase [Clostridium massiliodielmoense]|uniref:Cof-type HAD-IIB family hydrolase n=1 Tax=Clostridium massiliodielmoense TaxID=1776385 RepID=UPI000A2718AF|nr:Cof-type HAD-IIB family hydrolase [Clostridium massiliodielmoense]